MKTRMQYAALLACALLVIPTAASADNGSIQNQTSIQQTYLNAELSRITCQINHETSYMNMLISDISNLNQTALSSDSNKVSSDLQTLTTDVNDKHQFKTDLKSFRTDSINWTHDLRLAIKNTHPSSDEKTKLRNDLGNLRSSYHNCFLGAGKLFASARIHAYGIAIQKIQNKTKIMESKGINATQLNQLINQAQINLSNLAASVSSATNSSQLKIAMKSYCQYNGCKVGTNFHFAAQTALDGEQSALDAIKSNQNSGTYNNQIDKAQTDLTNAQNILNAVGTNTYHGTQQIDVWNALHDAHDIIKQLWKERTDKSTNTSPTSGTSE